MTREMHVQDFLHDAAAATRASFQIDFRKSGEVYVAGADGLHVYDGFRWRSLTMADGLPSNFVRSVLVDRDADRVWVGTDAGVVILDPADHRVVRVIYNELAGPNVRRIRRDREGSIWLCSDRWLKSPESPSGLTRFRSATGEATKFYSADGLPDEYTMDFYADSRGRNWVMTDNGLARQVGARFAVELQVQGEERQRRFWSMAESPDGTLLAATNTALWGRIGGTWEKFHNWKFGNPQLFLSAKKELLVPRPEFHRMVYPRLEDLHPSSTFRPKFNPFPFPNGAIRVEDVATAPDGAVWIVGRNLLLRWLQPGAAPGSRWKRLPRDLQIDVTVGSCTWQTTPEGLRVVKEGKCIKVKPREHTLPAPAPTGIAIACIATLANGRTYAGSREGLLRLNPHGSAWEFVTDVHAKGVHTLVATGNTLWIGCHSENGGTLLRYSNGRTTPFAIDVLRRVPGAPQQPQHTTDHYLAIDAGLCVIPSTGDNPYVIHVPDERPIASALRGDDGDLWLDVQTGWLRFRPDHRLPRVHCRAQATVAASDSLVVEVTAVEWFKPTTAPAAYSVRYRIDAAGWTNYRILRDGEIHLPRLAPGDHTLQVQVRDEGLDESTAHTLSFAVVRPGLSFEALLIGSLLFAVLAVVLTRFSRRRLARLESFRTLLGSSGAAVLTVDRQGTLIEASIAARRLLAIEPEDLGNLKVQNLLSTEEDRSIWDQLKNRGSLEGVECRLIGLDGTLLTTILTAVRTAGPRDAARGFRILLHDVTATKAIEQQLRQAQKMEGVGQLAGGIAHDFNNLLCGMIGYADLLKSELEESSSSPALRDFAQRIIDTGKTAGELTQQLLTFSRQGILQPVRIDVLAVVQEVATLLRRTIDPRIEIEIAPHSKPMIVQADRGQIHTAVLNLAINARDAMPHGGTLELGTRTTKLDSHVEGLIGPGIEPGDFVEVSVKDTGHGISKEDHARVFEPFYTTKEVGEGTGLGLATVYGTVVTHRGAIRVTSEVSVGTTMSIFLPLAENQAPVTPQSATPAPVPDLVGTILVVDDDEVVRQFMTRGLQNAGHKVHNAENGLEAVEFCAERGDELDLIVMDMVMPRMNGQDAMAKIRQQHPNLGFLVTTGFTLTQGEAELRSLGALGVLQKPFGNDALRSMVTSVLTQDHGATL